MSVVFLLHFRSVFIIFTLSPSTPRKHANMSRPNPKTLPAGLQLNAEGAFRGGGLLRGSSPRGLVHQRGCGGRSPKLPEHLQHSHHRPRPPVVGSPGTTAVVMWCLRVALRFFAIEQILFFFGKTYTYSFETDELPNPRRTQPKQHQVQKR